MCLLIVKPEGFTLPRSHIVNAMKANADGAGIVYHNGTENICVKGLFTVPDLMEEIEKAENFPAIIHMRLATHGEICRKFCHPFPVEGGYYMAHNGILTGFGNKGMSDTLDFCNQRLTGERIAHDLLGIEHEIGSFNKMAFISPLGVLSIANEMQGEWLDGVWYSNDSYSTPRKYSWETWETDRSFSTPFAEDEEEITSQDLLDMCMSIDTRELNQMSAGAVDHLIRCLEDQHENEELMEYLKDQEVTK